MKNISFILAWMFIVTAGHSQKTVTLWQCYDSAASATPLAREVALYSEMSVLRDRNLSVAFLPILDLNGNAVYISDIPDLSAVMGSLPLPAGAIPEIPHEQYRATLDISQVIWDGGVTRSAREVEKVVKELNLKQNEADIYRLREQVNNYYFSLLLTSRQMDVIRLLVGELETRIREARSGAENGIVPAVSLDILSAEKIKAGQSLTELEHRYDALLEALEKITGMDDLQQASFLLPEVEIPDATRIDHPDLRLFDIRNHQMEASLNLLRSQRMPRAFGFAQAGYGNPPGNNFFSDAPDIYYSLGVGLKWNIVDWKKNRNERKSLTVQQQLLDIRRSAMEESLQRVLIMKKSEIESLSESARSDDELIDIRKRVTAAAASQLENGTITASQYLTELNAEKQAMINADVRRISIARARIEYLNIMGQNNR